MTPADDQRFMRRAIALSEMAGLVDCTGGPFGAVIVRAGEIIAEGFNRVVAENDPTWHAEIAAIRNACKALNRFDLRGCTLYTSAEPCPMCAAACWWARLERIVYAAHCSDALQYGGFDDAVIYADLQKQPLERQISYSEMLRDEAIAVWQRYQAKPDKMPY